MDTSTASRSSRLPLLCTALLALVPIFGLAACSSSDPSTAGSDSSAAASEDAATNDVVTSSEVSLTIDFDQAGLQQLLEDGSQVMVAREVDTNSGGESPQVVWLALTPELTTTITYDPSDMQVFASTTELVPGAMIEEISDAGISEGETANWYNDAFDMTPGQPNSLMVNNGSNAGPTTFGLAGSATVNGSSATGPYVAASVYPMAMTEFSDSGNLMIWVSNEGLQSGTVLGMPPSTALTVDVGSHPTATLTFNDQTQTFELAN